MARKLVLVLVVTACVFSGTADAWSWSWGSGSGWGWGWGSDNSSGSSGSSSGSSGSNTGGSSFGWGWSFNGTDTNWGWGSSSGSNHSSGTGSTHKSHPNHTAPSNHSSGTSTGSTHIHYNYTTPSNHSSGIGSTQNNHTAPSNHSSGTGISHAAPSNHSVPISLRRNINVTVWMNGFHYPKWASKHAPFYINDVLVFKYNNDETPSNKHSNNDVYLFSDLRSYKRCDVTRGKKLEARGVSSPSSQGFKLLLRKAQAYYFASGDSKGCNHNMKFSLSPIPRLSSHTKP